MKINVYLVHRALVEAWWTVLVTACGTQFSDPGLNLGPCTGRRGLSLWVPRKFHFPDF